MFVLVKNSSCSICIKGWCISQTSLFIIYLLLADKKIYEWIGNLWDKKNKLK